MPRKGRPPKAPKVERTCHTCGKTWLQYEYETANTKYCSRACFHEGRRGQPRGPYVERERRKCKTCSSEFLVGGEDGRKRKKYCSIQCAAKRNIDKPGHEPPRTMDREEAAWLAGVFDGEGCIAWPRRHMLTSVRISIPNTNRELLERVREVTGTGKIREKTRYNKSPKHSRSWVWNCYSKNAHGVLSQILPWLIVKKHAARVGLGMTNATEPPWTQRTLTGFKAGKAEPQ